MKSGDEIYINNKRFIVWAFNSLSNQIQVIDNFGFIETYNIKEIDENN